MLAGYKTYIGIAMSLIGSLLKVFNITFISEADIQNIIDTALQFGGLIIAAYGRWKAGKGK